MPDLEQRRTWIKQPLDPFAREQLAAARMAVAALLIPAQRGLRNLGAQFLGQRPVVRSAGLGLRVVRVDLGAEDGGAH